MGITRLFRNELRIYMSHRIMAILLFIPLLFSFTPLIPSGSTAYIDYGMKSDPIEIKGVKISSDNPLYYELANFQEQLSSLEKNSYGLTESRRDLAFAYIDGTIDYTLKAAASFEGKGYDYRMDAYYSSRSASDRLFLFNHLSSPAIRWMFVYDDGTGKEYGYYFSNIQFSDEEFTKSYSSLSSSGKAEAIADLEAEMASYDVILSDSPDAFKTYVGIRVKQVNANIIEYERYITDLRSKIALAMDPVYISSLEREIASYENQITAMRDVELFVWQLRESRLVTPNDGSWQDTAINDYSNAKYQINYNRIVDEKEYLESPWLQSQYGSYNAYVSAINKQNESYAVQANRALQSVTTGKPDLIYVNDGIRQGLIRNLSLSRYVFILAALIGAWLLASEFQSGTIRLLLIRPVSRTRLLATKFCVGLVLSVAVYLAGTLLYALVFGLVHGFSDLANPVYQVTGETAFMSMYLPQLAAAAFSFIFAYTLAFFCAVLVHNVAVSVVIPSVFFVASFIVSNMLPYSDYGFSQLPGWIMLTPLPYIDVSGIVINTVLSNYYGGYYGGGGYYPGGIRYFEEIRSLASSIRGATATLQASVPSAATCVAVLAVLSLVLLAASLYIFKKKDITN